LRFPHDEHERARPHRVSPLHYRLLENGAVFGEKFGWERVNYFQPGKESRRMGEDHRAWGWAKPPYFERMRQEHTATRERVALYDLTSFGKIEVKGPGALPLLQRLTSSNINKPVGSAIYTQFLNTRGGIESDLTVTRLGEEHFWVITGSGFIANDHARLLMHVDEKDGDVSIRDITQEYACLALWGPKARDVLKKITSDDVSNGAHPYLMTKPVNINGARVLAQRVSYAGELGWELYIANNRATMVWDMLIEAGKEFGMELGGYKVLDPLRLEKGFKYFTVDITPTTTPYEAGLGFCVDLEKGEFIGREALVKQKAEGITRKLCTLTLTGTEEFVQIYGGEAVYHGDTLVTRVRSGGYGFTVKKNIFYAYLPIELAKKGERFTIELIEGNLEAEVTANVLVDPKSEKLKA
jgi:4-methylaminobutanoate oxidase (formaldehyde-forming)